MEVFEIIKCGHKAQVPVVQRVDNAIHWINHYLVDNVVCFTNSAVPLGKDLSGG